MCIDVSAVHGIVHTCSWTLYSGKPCSPEHVAVFSTRENVSQGRKLAAGGVSARRELAFGRYKTLFGRSIVRLVSCPQALPHADWSGIGPLGCTSSRGGAEPARFAPACRKTLRHIRGLDARMCVWVPRPIRGRGNLPVARNTGVLIFFGPRR